MRHLLILALALVAAGCSDSDRTASTADAAATNGAIEVLHVDDVDWGPLNPARGDASPRAGTLWGDRGEAVPTGFLAEFVDGFSSPPHAHNVTYRAVVIFGTVHNDDPDAAEMWMPPGSFWTQPEGEVHITSAKGLVNLALVEVDEGPYRVIPPEEAFETRERPINIDAQNLVWVDRSGRGPADDAPQVAYLWGRLEDGQPNGTFVKLPAGFTGEVRAEGAVFRAVVVTGRPKHAADDRVLKPGSYFGSRGSAVHRVSSADDGPTILYVRTNGPYELTRGRE